MAIKKNKRVTKRKARRSKTASMSGYLSNYDSNHPENFIECGFAGTSIGGSTGASNTGSMCWTPATLNQGGASATEIQVGTGINKRLGNHIILTRLLVRCYATMTGGSRLRVMVFINPRDNLDTAGGMSTNTILTGAVENAPFLRAPTNSLYGTAPGVIDYMLDPACEHQVIYDKMYGPGDHSGSFDCASLPLTCTSAQPIGSAVVPIELDLDLQLPVMYSSSGYPTCGDLMVYLVSSNSNAWAGTITYPTVQLSGTVRLNFVNAVNLESIGKSIRDFVDEAGTTVEHVSKSPFLRFLQTAAPYVTKIFGW
jgi:hypothetical protein